MLGLRHRSKLGAVLALVAPLLRFGRLSLGRVRMRRGIRATAMLMLVLVVVLVAVKFHGGLEMLLSWRTGIHNTAARPYESPGEAPTPIARPNHSIPAADGAEAFSEPGLPVEPVAATEPAADVPIERPLQKEALIHKSEEEIKEAILALTPIGSHAAKVIKTIKENLHITAEYKNNFWGRDPNPPYPERYYHGRIYACLGSTEPVGGYPVVTELLVGWEFDAMDNLKEVVVIKQPTGT
jgi:hypothetical protein